MNYTHEKSIDVIYIDPPYNTGNKDFIFNDRYVDIEDGYRHSKWVSFMEKRLKLAKNLLKDTGVIFISIDDNELAQLKMLMDEPSLFGEAEPTDKNKKKLTEEATEMLCIKEAIFELVLDRKKFKVFKNSTHYTGIIFDQLAIQQFKKAIKDIKAKFSAYVFSLGDDTFDEEFADVKQKVQLSPIPEAILRAYRRIFK